ncbi:MAG: cytidine deaminase [Micavibrio sp.]|nr:cytidine deaminase [Micavibrio sp.]
MKALSSAQLKKMAKLAATARDNAYCPYSNHPVGAAILTEGGKIFAGSNVEVAHYKGVCAEASAISAMCSAGGRKIKAVVVVGPTMKYLCTPCGDCRQRIREFAEDGAIVYSMWKDGSLGEAHAFADLLPHSFGPENVSEVAAAPKKNHQKKKKK